MTDTGIIYAVRDTESGKLVSDITAGRTTYYKSYSCAENAVQAYRARSAKPKHGKLEIVAFALNEIATYDV